MRTTVYYLLAEETGKLPMLPKENSNLKSLAHKRRQKTEIVAPRQSGSWKGKFTAPASVYLPLSTAELRDWGSIDEIAT